MTLPFTTETLGADTLPSVPTSTPGGTLLRPPGESGVADVDTGEGSASATPARIVVGLDLSLNRTGVATRDGAASLVPPNQLDGFKRMRWIRAAVLDRTNGADLVVVEAPAYSSNGKYAKENAGLWHVVMIAVDARGTRWIDAMNTTVKKYATGNGRIPGKDPVVIAAVKRLSIDVTNNDEADAAWLCAIGHDLLDQPLVQMPASHRCALDAVRARMTPMEDQS